MSSQSEDDSHDELPFDIDEVMAAKRNNPGMFVSAWQADENDINLWTNDQIKGASAISRMRIPYLADNCQPVRETYVPVVITFNHIILKGNKTVYEFLDDPKKQFIVAAENNDLSTIRSLIESAKQKGADGEVELRELLSAKDQDGYTALHRAAYGGHVEVLQYLMKYGANINNRTEDGWTPLHSAAFWNKLSCVQLLISAGADLNALTNSGQTALHLAVSNNQGPETLYLLIAQPGAPVYGVRNKLGDEVADIVKRNTPYGDICYAFSEPATNL